MGTNLDMLQEKKGNPCVQFRKLTEVATIVRGITYPKTAEIHNNSGFPVLRANNIELDNNKLNFNDVVYLDRNFPVQNRHKLQKGDILISIASGSAKHIGKVAYIESDIDYYFGGFLAVVRSSPQVLSRFLFFCLTSSSFSKYLTEKLNTSTINNLSSSILSSFSIPCPSSDIQLEIVRILDRFTLLKAELEAELEARLAQYRYYRDALLDFSPAASATRPGFLQSLINLYCKRQTEVIDVINAVNIVVPSKKLNKKQYQDSGRWPIIDQGQEYIIGYTDDESAIIPKNEYVLFGDHTLTLKFVDFSFAQGSDGLKILKVANNKINTKFLYQSLINLKIQSRGYSRHWMYLSREKIAIPPLPVQEAIVEILDRFETLVHDMREGLPAEIALRQKQYEYYRDKLLSF